MSGHACTRAALGLLRAAVEAGEYERAMVLMAAYDRQLRELATDTETARASLQQLLDEQQAVIDHFQALRVQAGDELRGLRHAGIAARAYLQ